MTAEQRRLLDLDNLVLGSGAHSAGDGFCVMEAVSFVAGEPHSDHPTCASEVIGTFMRRWNDDLDDAGRQRLKPYILKLVGTLASAEIEQRRSWMCVDWMVRVHTAAWLELAGLTEQATALRELPEIVGAETLNGAKPAINAGQKKAAAAWDAAGALGAAARDAAWDAAWAAAMSAVGAAAGAAARDAAWAAARSAAGAAAWAAASSAAGAAARDAAWAAARSAAWDAASKKLEPTKLALQDSALALLDKMIALSAGAAE